MTFKRLALLPAALLFVSLAFAAPAGALSRHGRGAGSHSSRFYARVVSASRSGVMVRTLSGRSLRFSAAQIASLRAPLARRHVRGSDRRTGMWFAHMAGDVPRPAPPVAIDTLGLQPGVTVLIAKTVSGAGRVTVEIALPPANVTVQQTDSGVVTHAEGDSFQITDRGGAALRFTIGSGRRSAESLRGCSTVSVTYHQAGSVLIADRVLLTGTSASGDCNPASAATRVAYAERYVSGRVTAVRSRSVTIFDGSSGRSETFVADPSQGLQLCTYAFDGVHVGDQIDVTFHRSQSRRVADSVSDPGAGS